MRRAIALFVTGASCLLLTLTTPSSASEFAPVSCHSGTACVLRAPWSTANIGSVGQVGHAESLPQPSVVVLVDGAGADIWATSDSFRFVYQPFSGDGEIVARVVAQDSTHPFAKAGVMLRSSIDPASPHVILDVKPDGGLEFMARYAWRSDTVFLAGAQAAPMPWLKLARSGGQVSALHSADGTTWLPIGSVDLMAMPRDLLAGLAVTSHDPAVVNHTVFDNASVTSGGPSLLVSGGFEEYAPPALGPPGWISDQAFRQSPAKSETNQPRSGAKNGACWTPVFLDCGLYQDVIAPATGSYTLQLYATADRPGGLVGANVNGMLAASASVDARGFLNYGSAYKLSVTAASGNTIRVWMYSPATPGYVVIDDVALTQDRVLPVTEVDLVPPIGTPSQAFGINDIGTVVGRRSVFGTNDVWVPFAWTAASGVHDLGEMGFLCFGTPCDALSVNNNNEIVGAAGIREPPPGYLWGVGHMTAISAGPANAINDVGTIVGSHYPPSFPSVHWQAYRWTQATGLQGFEPPGGFNYFAPLSEARAIRNDGLVAGYRDQAAVVWQALGVFTVLGEGVVNAINDNSLAVGTSAVRGGGSAILWRDATAIEIAPGGEAFDVNEAGYVVGTLGGHAFVWHDAFGPQDLGPGTAHGIDEAGRIVGWRTTQSGNRATAWQIALRVDDLFIGLNTIASRLLTGIDTAMANEIIRNISDAWNAWRTGDPAEAHTRIEHALRIAEDLRNSGMLPDNRATALLSLGNTLMNRF